MTSPTPDLEPAGLEAATAAFVETYDGYSRGLCAGITAAIRAYLAARLSVPVAGKAVDATMVEAVAKAMWAVHAPANPWENALDEDYYDGPGRDGIRKMARAAIPALASVPAPSGAEPVAWLDMRNEPTDDWTKRCVATNPGFVENNGPENFVALVPATPQSVAPIGEIAGLVDTCDEGHKFVKLPDHPTKDGKARCPHCLAIGLGKARMDLTTSEAESTALRRKLEEAEAEIERMTPKFVAYEYLESPAGREMAEARVAVLEKALAETLEVASRNEDGDYVIRAKAALSEERGSDVG